MFEQFDKPERCGDPPRGIRCVLFGTLEANWRATNTGFCDNTPDQIFGPYADLGGNSLLHCPPPAALCPTDINGDGVTNVLDLIELLLAFGAVCP